MRKLLINCPRLCLFALMLMGCTAVQTEHTDGTVTVNSQLCKSGMDFTSSVIGHYTIKIFQPNDSKNPDIWQGPVCIESETRKVHCGFDLSLVKSVKPAGDMKSMDVVVFSGSNSHTARITLATCEIKFLD